MASSKASPTVPTSAEDSPLELIPITRPSQASGINRLPVELLHLIVWSLPRAKVDTKSLGRFAWDAWETEGKGRNISLPPRPQDLYPLARTCKGFWQCLFPLLYHFDVMFWTAVFKPDPSSPEDWHDPEDWLVESPSWHSALSWGIENNEMATVKLSVGAARAVGDLEVYAGITRRRLVPSRSVIHDECCDPAGSLGYADAFFQAVLHGNTAAVKLLTEDADASILNRPLHPESTLWYANWLTHMLGSYGTNMDTTILHFAIALGHADIVQVLLTRYSQLNQNTLKWYEPSALPIAAHFGNVKIASLIIHGTSIHSPWVARARSQFLDPRSYLSFGPHHHESGIPRPPMIMAGLGMLRKGWCENGDEIFSFLAQWGGNDLLTQDCRWSCDTGESRTPLECALVEHDDADLPIRASPQLLPDDSRIVRLIRCGALNTRSWSKFPMVTTRLPGVHAIEILWGWVWLQSSARVDFMGRCWDAALDHHGELDEQFVWYWVAGAERILCGFLPLWETPRRSSQDIDELETHVALISLFESKAQGFAQHPPIRAWLDRFVFQRSSRREINHTSMKGNWRHLM